MAVLEKDVDTLVNLLRTIGVVEELEDYSDFKLEMRYLLERYYSNLHSDMREILTMIRKERLAIKFEHRGAVGQILTMRPGDLPMLTFGFSVLFRPKGIRSDPRLY